MDGLGRADEILLDAFAPTFVVMCGKMERMQLSDADHLAKKCFVIYLARGIRVFKCFALLAKQGYLDEANMLTRTLFEIVVDLRYLKRSPLELSRRFWSYFDACQCRGIRKERQMADADDRLRESFTEHEMRSIEEARQVYLAQYPTTNGKFPDHWSGMSVCDRAREVGLLPTYLTTYHVQSDCVHTGPYGFASCMDFSDPAAFGINTGPDWTDACMIVDGACAHMWECLMIVEDGMELSCYDTIHVLYEIFATHTGIPKTGDMPSPD